MSARLAPWILAAALLLSLAAAAQPALTVSPATVDWNNTAPIRVTASGLTADRLRLRLYVDVDQTLTLTANDYLVWDTVAGDDGSAGYVAEWSPVMFSDQDPAAGTVALDLGAIAPFRFPHTAGHYLFQAEDGSTGLKSAAVPFLVTQTTETIQITGQVVDDVGAGVAGAVVVLLPLGDNGSEGFGEDWERWGPSCISDPAQDPHYLQGYFQLNVPASSLEAGACTQRLAVAMKPGYMTQLLIPNQPLVTLDGPRTLADPVRLRLATGSTLAGNVAYSSGPRTGQGIPGSLVFAVSEDGPSEFTVAVTGADGHYSMPISSHPFNGSRRFTLNCWDPLYLAYQGAVGRDDGSLEVDLDTPPTSADLAFPAASAFVQGTLRDPSGTPLGAGYLVHAKDLGYLLPSPTPAYRTNGLTGPDGTFRMGVVGGTGTTQAVLLNRAYIPAGKIAVGATCVSVPVGAWPTAVSQDLALQDPAFFVTGRVRTPEGEALGGLSVRATAHVGCAMWNSRAFTSCADGSYSLPAAAATWTFELDPGELNGGYRDIDSTSLSKSVPLTGSRGGADFILGGWAIRPALTEISPAAGYDDDPLGVRVPIVLRGTGLSLGSAPTVTWRDETGAALTGGSVLGWRPDLGELYVTAPNSPDGAPYVRLTVTVRNVDLGLDSAPLCYTAMGPAPETTPCTLSGTVFESDGTTGLPGALVKVSDQARIFQSLALTDGSGQYSVTLRQAGSYRVSIFPPDLTTYAPAFYATVLCDGTRNHTCTAGSHVTGQVVDEGGSGISNAQVEFQTSAGGIRIVTDMDGGFDLRVPATTYPAVRFLGPPTSRYISYREEGVALTSDHGFGPVPLVRGVLLAGRVQGSGLRWIPDWGSLASRTSGAPRTVEAYRTSDGTFAGRANMSRAETCDGGFSIGLPEGVFVRLLLGDSDPSRAPATVLALDLDWDSFAEFPFPVYDEAGPTTPEPRFGRDLKSHGQVGEPVDIWGSNFGSVAGAVQPSFYSSVDQWLYGDDVQTDPDRGLVLTRVPSGADTTYLDLELDRGAEGFIYSEVFPFAIDGGTFDPGTTEVTGTVTDGTNPVSGALVALLTGGMGNCGSGSNSLHDYAVTDAGGGFSLHATAGSYGLVVFPPVASGLAGTVVVPTGAPPYDIALQAGEAITVTVTDGVNPVAGARVSANGEGTGTFDTRLTDASGVAILPLLAGTYRLEVLGPEKDRFVGHSESLAVTGPASVGVALTRGRMATERAVTPDGEPVPLCQGQAQDPANSDSEYGFGLTRAEGWLSLPVPPSTSFTWNFMPRETGLGDSHGTEDGVATDTVKYPSVSLSEAGVIAGTVTALATGAPLEGIRVRVFPASNPTVSLATEQTCSDGSYRIKMAAGSGYAVSFNEGDTDVNEAYASEYNGGVFCTSAVTPFAVTTGSTVTVDDALDPAGIVSGTVYDGSTLAPLEGAAVLAYATSPLGACSPLGAATDGSGNYRMRLPAGSYRVEAQYGEYTPQCWNHVNGCASYTPVVVAGGSNTSGIRFDLGSVPLEVPATGTPLRVAKGSVEGEVRVTFTKPSGGRSYNVYAWSGFNTGAAPAATYCHLVSGSPGFTDNGDGTVTYTFSPPAGARGFLASASNSVAEGSLGYSTSGERDSPPSSWRCGAGS